MTAPALAKAAGHACPWCHQLVDHDTIPPWWLDHQNLAELYEYLTGAGCPEGDELDPAATVYFLEKPWKWTEERARMLVAKEKAK